MRKNNTSRITNLNIDTYNAKLATYTPYIEAIDIPRNVATPLKHLCKKCNNIFIKSPANILAGLRHGTNRLACSTCNKQKYTTKTYADKLLSLNKNIIPIEPIAGIAVSILHKCTICQYEFKNKPNKIIYGQGCPKCHNVWKRSKFEYIQEFEEITNSIVINNIDEYTNDTFLSVSANVDVRCTKCNYVWKSSLKAIKRNKGICPHCDKKPAKYSRKAIAWLNLLNNNFDCNIIHAENGKEHRIPYDVTNANKVFSVDGYDAHTNIVYEFLGDKFHGNLNIFDAYDKCCFYAPNLTAKELNTYTFNRLHIINQLGYCVKYIWEYDYDHQLNLEGTQLCLK